jgi:hypothetical protein
MDNRLPFKISLFLLIVSTSMLISGSPLLTEEIIEGLELPWGNLITWIALMSLPCTQFFGIEKIRYPHSSALRAFNISLKVIMVFSFLWIAVSYFLAGNWSFTFTPSEAFRGSTEASFYFWGYTLMLVMLPLLVIIIYGLHLLFKLSSGRKGR